MDTRSLKMKFQIVICGFLLCPPFFLARADNGRGYAGTASANFLKLGVGARTLAMGETGTATADDVNALYWNPANLSLVKQGSLSLMQNAYAESISYQYAAYAHPTPEWGTFGGAFQRLSAGDILQTDEAGRELGDFSPRDLAMSFGWGRSLTEPWHVGASVKFIQSKIINSASTFALDMGAAYRKEKLTVGTSLRNIGGRMKFDQERE